MAEKELKPCPFCGRKMVFHRGEYEKHIIENGRKVVRKVVEQYYMHEDKEAKCILDEICMPLVIGVGDATDDYIGEYPELWNRRADNGKL